jgi:hypothetical protein
MACAGRRSGQVRKNSQPFGLAKNCVELVTIRGFQADFSQHSELDHA